MKVFSLTVFLFIGLYQSLGAAAQDDTVGNTTTISKRVFTYSGSLLPSDWSVVSIVNDRAIIGFNNGSARNANMSELDLKDRVFLERLQNGTVYNNGVSSTREKLAQWSSQFSTSVSKLGKSIKEQFESLINSNKNQPEDSNLANRTIPVV